MLRRRQVRLNTFKNQVNGSPHIIMSPFIFPNPALESKIIHPETKEIWEFIEGVWQVTGLDDDDHLHEQMSVNTASVSSLTTEVDQNEEQLQALSTNSIKLKKSSR